MYNYCMSVKLNDREEFVAVSLQELRIHLSVQAAVLEPTVCLVHHRVLSVRLTHTQPKAPLNACNVTAVLTTQVRFSR